MCCPFSSGRPTCSGDLLNTFGERIKLIVSFAIVIFIVAAEIWIGALISRQMGTPCTSQGRRASKAFRLMLGLRHIDEFPNDAAVPLTRNTAHWVFHQKASKFGVARYNLFRAIQTR